MKKVLIFSFVLMFSITSFGQKKKGGNPYHTAGTKEYNEVTSKLLGLWTISSFTQKDKNKMEAYDNATFEFVDKGIFGGECIFRFKLKKDIVDQRLHAWNKKGVTLTVDDYYVICMAEFKISKKGVLVYLDEQQSTVEITGSGEQLENFRNTEKTYIESQSSMKESGGIGNLIGAKLVKDVSNTDFVPKIPTQLNYKNLTDNSVDFIALQKINFKLTK